MQKRIEQFAAYFYPEALDRTDTEEVHKHRIFILACYVTLGTSGTFIFLDWMIGYYLGSLLMLIASLTFITLPFLLKRGVSKEYLMVVFNLMVAVIYIMVINSQKGFSFSPTAPWILVLPIMALLMSTRRLAIFWYGIACLIIAWYSYTLYAGFEYPLLYPENVDFLHRGFSYLGLVTVFFFVMKFFNEEMVKARLQVDKKVNELQAINTELEATFEQLKEQQKLVESEREKSNKLLLNILPQATAQELMETGSATTRGFASATLMFADFVAFSEKSRTMPPRKMITALDQYFRAFDAIIKKHNLEKVKTMGDSYMCAGGIPVENNTHPVNIVKAAFEFLDVTRRFAIEYPDGPQFEIRIGVHTGPLVAGVVGQHKFSYDIYGDSVNIAWRVKRLGAINEVNISETTYNLVKAKFDCEPLGAEEIKDLGAIQLYRVVGPKG
jgi:class 3 adenylate cyclase